MNARAAYLLEVTHRMPTLATFRTLVDILCRYRYEEFFVYRDEREDQDEFDEEVPPVPPRLKGYCEMQGIALNEIDSAGLARLSTAADSVLASTFAARSLAGRIEEMRHQLETGEVTLRARKAKRFVVTDFSDGYEWQPLAVSLPAIILGGNLVTGGAKAARMDLEKELCSVMDLPLGGLLQKLGTLYLRGGALREEASEFFNILAGDPGYSRHPGITQSVLDEVSGICRGIRVSLERWTNRNDWAREIAYAAALLDASCHRRHETMLRALRDEHGHLWRLRFEEFGRVRSLSRLPRF